MALIGKSDITNLQNIESLDDFFAKTQYIGSIDKALSNNLYGINHQTLKPVVLNNKDAMGFTFFTRPQLNLSTTNLRNIRHLYSLLTDNRNSIQMYVRNMLDPRLMLPNTKKNTRITGNINRGTLQNYIDNGAHSIFVDNELAFIPVFTNTIKSMSGWPDIVAPTFTSKSGMRGEQWSIVDGTSDIYEAFDLDCTFRNVRDEPITMMIGVWIKYMVNVFEGMMSPYIDQIAANRIDYNTRIYRLVMDESKRFVKKIAATGASFPVNDPMGRIFDFSDGVNYNDQNNELNIRFKCNGAMYNDDILIDEFNKTNAMFNSNYRSMLNGGNTSLVAVPYNLLQMFNNRGYPYINPETLELKWLVDTNSLTYKSVMGFIKAQQN